MGEQAELIINGDVCQVCGENFEDEGDGYPRTCESCLHGDDDQYAMYKKVRQDRRANAEPGRIRYAMNKLENLGPLVRPTLAPTNDQIIIHIHCNRIDFWPFTGWFCGRKPIGHIKGRGIANLIKEIKKI